MPGILVASGYCRIFLYTEVPGSFPRIAVLGLVTCKRILAKDILTCNNTVRKKNEITQDESHLFYI